MSISLTLVALFVLVIGYVLSLSYEEKWNSNKEFAENILRSKSREILHNFELYKRSIDKTDAVLEKFNLKDIPPALISYTLFDKAAFANGMDEILVSDENGNIILSSSQKRSAYTSVKNCDYFSHFKTKNDDDFYFSQFCLDATRESDGEIALSKRISHPDGRFAGVIVARISLAYISDSFKDLNLGSNDTIFLVTESGRLLLRIPEIQDKTVLTNYYISSVFLKIKENKNGSFTRKSDIDGITRFYVFEDLKKIPVFMSIAISKDAIISEWYKEAIISIAVSILACLSIIIVAFLITKETALREDVERKLEKLSVTDSLTGLFNRRYFDEQLAREWLRAKRKQSPLALLMVDADNFKQLNDRFGHQLGDDVLVRLTEAIKAGTRRPGDFAARYGGDEFTVVLPDTDEQQAMKVAQIIRARFREECLALNIPAHDGGSAVSASIGAASLIPNEKSEPRELIAMADKDLYREKARRPQSQAEASEASDLKIARQELS